MIISVAFLILTGIEKEYEQRVLPDGKVNVDGFLCVFDVSQVPNRSLERQVELTASILNNCLKTKRPVVLVTTKNDEANEVTLLYCIIGFA
ncbi:Rho GTPase-activating protein 190 [Portunus trituberculatus]|uniref:Rho GTPase-activating protein 190 n=1 Tax=Portunus trituberculatus TaxID=210409 RepID=A0A5B7JHW6_PORTR|nr:Rho GTPase-activating protein 190 [Portunus trituberculatus]